MNLQIILKLTRLFDALICDTMLKEIINIPRGFVKNSADAYRCKLASEAYPIYHTIDIKTEINFCYRKFGV
jgi:hypothetical protein